MSTQGADHMADTGTVEVSRGEFEPSETINRADLVRLHGTRHTQTIWGTIYTDHYRHDPTGQIVANQYREPVNSPRGFDAWYFDADDQHSAWQAATGRHVTSTDADGDECHDPDRCPRCTADARSTR